MEFLPLTSLAYYKNSSCNKYVYKKTDFIIRSVFFVVIELDSYMPTYAFDLNDNVTVDRWNINTYFYVLLALCC